MIEKDNYFYVLPQALSCKLGYSLKGLDITDTNTGSMGEAALNNYLIVDGGFYTLDWATVIGSKASAGAAVGIKDSGVIRIVYNIARIIPILMTSFKELIIEVNINALLLTSAYPKSNSIIPTIIKIIPLTVLNFLDMIGYIPIMIKA